MSSFSKHSLWKLFRLILIFSFCVGFSSAVSYQEPEPLPFDPLKIHVLPEPDDGLEIRNIKSYLMYWNERLGWQYSESQIINASVQLETYANHNLPRNGDYYHIKNITDFNNIVSLSLNLSSNQALVFCNENYLELDQAHQNYHEIINDPGLINKKTLSCIDGIVSF